MREMIKSVQGQTYDNWELCIVNASPENDVMRRVLAEYFSKRRPHPCEGACGK